MSTCRFIHRAHKEAKSVIVKITLGMRIKNFQKRRAYISGSTKVLGHVL